MIELDKYEKNWILLIKGHFRDKFPTDATNWSESLIPMFKETYFWGEGDYYNHYLGVMFNILLDIHLKIQLDGSGTNQQLKSIFSAAFYKGIVRNQEKPIERAIGQLCGEIQSNQVFVNGVARYEL